MIRKVTEVDRERSRISCVFNLTFLLLQIIFFLDNAVVVLSIVKVGLLSFQVCSLRHSHDSSHIEM